MTGLNGAFEATLLSAAEDPLDDGLLGEEVRDIVEDHGEVSLRFDRLDDVHLLMTCETVQILIALNTIAPPIDGLRGVQRPDDTAHSHDEVLDRLVQAGASTIVIVLPARDLPPDQQPPDALMRTICWEMIEALNDLLEGSLIYWAEGDMLYTAEEFDELSQMQPFGGPRNIFVPLPHPISQAPTLSAAAEAWLGPEARDSGTSWAWLSDAATSALTRLATAPRVASLFF